MIRWTLIYLALAGIVLLGFRDWFKALCALVVLTVLNEHHYFRDPIAGVSGLRFVNILIPILAMQWLYQRSRETPAGETPPALRVGVVAYVLVLLHGFVLMLPEIGILLDQGWPLVSLIYNEVAWPLITVLMAIMIYDGARSRGRILLAMASLVVMATLAAAYIIKLIPVSSLLDPGSVLKYRHRIEREFGLHPNDVVTVLVPGMWISIGCLLLTGRKYVRLLLSGAIAVMGVALLLTQSRTGMVALLGVSLLLGLVRFRAVTLATLAVFLVILVSLPSIAANWSRGVSVNTLEGQSATDLNEVTNGRLELWRLAWSDVLDSPVIGHGRRYWMRGPAGHEDVTNSHPHNSYLEVWMEYGGIGLAVILGVFGSLLAPALRMLKRGALPLELAAGLGATACLLTHFVVGFGGRAFLPRVTIIITFVMCALAMRVYVASRPAAMARHSPAASGAVRRVRPIRYPIRRAGSFSP